MGDALGCPCDSIDSFTKSDKLGMRRPGGTLTRSSLNVGNFILYAVYSLLSSDGI